mmetsp:Transcript_35700/g.83571  ORF Transcript_35700/g.83571 Transcript_35700/m.83571 type:complete len:456 (+) Transcript_35700:131-1498(+)
MDEKYQRIKVLGKGSFGKAYLVRNVEANAFCVVKQMETSTMEQKERNEAVKEAMLLKKMDHPNIVRFQEVFMTRKGRLCIVMDYADGGDVHQAIKASQGNLFPESKIVEWFVQVCFALKHVHDRKVLHRDLKTQNIFLMATGQVKLGDFGIAKVLDATKDYAKTMVGTPYYLSPEIIEDRPYNFKSDVWSCGVVLYEMVTLKHPFDADSLVILASKILKDQYPAPDKMYSENLQSLIKCMLSKNADVRPTIKDILGYPYLFEDMQRANEKYRLNQNLSEFAPREGGASCTSTSMSHKDSTWSGPGGHTDDEYEEEFEDYSGSEDEVAKAAHTELNRSVANLKLAPKDQGPPAPVATGSSAPDRPGVGSSAAAAGPARVGAKAAALRSYLLSQVDRTQFDKAYALVCASGETGKEDLSANVAHVLGEAKAPELITLFQLLCFLENVAQGSQPGLPP